MPWFSLILAYEAENYAYCRCSINLAAIIVHTLLIFWECTQTVEYKFKLPFFLSVFCFIEPVSSQNTLASVTLSDN